MKTAQWTRRDRGVVVGPEIASGATCVTSWSAGSGDVVVRLGGDEFAIVMPHTTEHGVRELADRLAAASRDGMPAVFSIGWALRETDEPLESTLRRADKMLLLGRGQERGSG